jgi:hypothetical protein
MECRGVGRRWTVIRLSSQLRRSLHYEYPSTIPESIPGTHGSHIAIHRLLIRLLNKLLLMTAIQFLPYPVLRKVYRRGIGINTSTMYSAFLGQMSHYYFLKDSYPCRNYLFQISVTTERRSASEDCVFFVQIIINFEFLYQMNNHQLLKETVLHEYSSFEFLGQLSDYWHHNIYDYCIYFYLSKIYFPFICGLFNDAVSVSDYMFSSSRMISESWIGKYVEGSGRNIMYSISQIIVWRD